VSRSGSSSFRPGSWVLDPARSSAKFRYSAYWGLAPVRGKFTKMTGSGEVLADGTARGRLQIVAESLDTQFTKRDEHLRSRDFFNPAKYPTILAELTKLALREDGKVAVEGKLTVAGVTQPLSFEATVTESARDAVTLRAQLAVDRRDFGMKWNQLGMVSRVGKVTMVTRFTRKPG
jgi:polyisoprenoid-binding protein YceI